MATTSDKLIIRVWYFIASIKLPEPIREPTIVLAQVWMPIEIEKVKKVRLNRIT
jgi:hypothetical protein